MFDFHQLRPISGRPAVLRRLWSYRRAILAILLAGAAVAARAADELPRPNVILVLTDDQGYGDLSCHGNPVLKTPHLDRLAAESVRLTDFHAAPMCTPTRGQLLTGVDALRNGATNTSCGQTLLRREFVTMPEVFAANGYRTAIFGKWHLGDNYPYRPQDRGFQESVWFPSASLTAASCHWNNDYFDDVYFHNGASRTYEGYCTDVFFREAAAWIRQRAAKGEPFFCYLPLNAPHGPLFVPDRYRKAYAQQPPWVAKFFGMIANIDENIGRLEEVLRETGLRENTLVVFMTDNGSTIGANRFNAGMRGRKAELYEGGHRVPFFVRWPAGELRAAGELDGLSQAQDVLPTLIDLCGLEQPKRTVFDGLSLAAVLRGKSDRLPERMLVVQYSRPDKRQIQEGDAAVLWNKWRLVQGSELFDLSTDPLQRRNVIAQHPQIAAKMRQHYAAWWSGVKARVNEAAPIHVGSDHENPSVLTPCHWRDGFLDQQDEIRRKRANGVWVLEIERDDEYEIALRRWPVESGAEVCAPMPSYSSVQIEQGRFPASEAWPVSRAQLQIAGQKHAKTVAPADQDAVFSVALQRGRTELETWFFDAAGQEIGGAYYVYVRRR